MSTYYRDLRDKIFQVESGDFNPYTESLEGRVGQLSSTPNANVPQPQETASNTPINYSEAYTSKGYDDPFENMVTADGKLDESVFSTGYNLLQRDPSIGITQDQYMNYTNTNYPQVLQNSYGKDNYNLTRSDTGGIIFPRNNEVINRRFEKSSNKEGDLFLMFDDNTNEQLDSFKTEKDYKDAISKDLESKGITGTTSKNIYDISRIYGESKDKEELAANLEKAGIKGVSMDEALIFDNKKR